GGLAGPVGADEPQDLAAVHRERQAVQRHEGAVLLRQSVRHHDRLTGTHGPPLPSPAVRPPPSRAGASRRHRFCSALPPCASPTVTLTYSAPCSSGCSSRASSRSSCSPPNGLGRCRSGTASPPAHPVMTP